MENDTKAPVRRIYEDLVNQGNLAAADEILAPDFVEHIPIPIPGQPTVGPAALTWVITALRTAFPDLHVTIEQEIAEGDVVAARVTWHGTHRGELLGIAPSGRQIKVTGLDFCRVEDGKIEEHWGQIDIISFLQQLDLMPEPMGTPV